MNIVFQLTRREKENIVDAQLHTIQGMKTQTR